MFVENNHLVLFNYMDLLILIHPFPTDPAYRQICVEYILTRSASSPDREEVKRI